MTDSLRSLLPFLAILNPFALCLYLEGVMADLGHRDFLRVLAQATGVSFLVFAVFALFGDALLVQVLGTRPAALRVFGGVIFFVIGYNYVMRGYRAAVMLRGSLEELPSAIALPYMIGAGTITQSILLGKRHAPAAALFVLLVGMAITFAVVVAYRALRDGMRGGREQVFDRYVNILSRINGLLIGAISTEMVVAGLHDIWELA